MIAVLLSRNLILIKIERFESLTNPGKLMAISYWRDEESVERWRNLTKVIRDYTMNDRTQAPEDSRAAYGK